MAVDRIVVSALGPDRRAASLGDGRLVDFALARRPGEILSGDIFLARVSRLARELDAVFVDLGAGIAGFVMREDLPDKRWPAEGDAILLRVSRSPEDGKAAKLTARWQPAGGSAAASRDTLANRAAAARAPVLIAPAGDPILRAITAAEGPALRQIVVDDALVLAELRTALPALAERLSLYTEPTDVFERYDVNEALDAALSPEIALPSGGRLAIYETPALIAVDIDAGRASLGGPQQTVLIVNSEAMVALAAAARLRRLGGTILIDLIPMRARRHQSDVLARLKQAFAADEAVTSIDGIDPRYHKLLRVIRTRAGPSLRQLLTAECPACAGLGRLGRADLVAGAALRRYISAVASDPGRRLALAVTPSIAAALDGSAAAVGDAAAARLGRPADLIIDASLPGDGYAVRQR